MNTKRKILIGTGLILICLTAVIFIEDNSKYVEFLNERTVKGPVEFLEVQQIDRRLDLMTVKEGKLYFVNWSDGTLVKYDFEKGKIDNVFGKLGEGPKENLNISSFAINDFSYTTIDQRKHTIQEVSFNDSLIRYDKLSLSLWASIRLNDSFLVNVFDQSENYKMNIKSISDNDLKISNVEMPSEDFLDEEFAGLKNHGFFVKNKNFEVLVPFNNDKFFVFNKTPEFVGVQEMIYNTPDPIFKWVNKNLIPDRDNLEVNNHGYLDDKNRLYVISFIGEKRGESRMIDIYDIDSKVYLESLEISNINDESVREVVVEGDLMYLLYSSSIAICKLI